MWLIECEEEKEGLLLRGTHYVVRVWDGYYLKVVNGHFTVTPWLVNEIGPMATRFDSLEEAEEAKSQYMAALFSKLSLKAFLFRKFGVSVRAAKFNQWSHKPALLNWKGTLQEMVVDYYVEWV